MTYREDTDEMLSDPRNNRRDILDLEHTAALTELAREVDAAHGEGLLDNLPCELCGRIEQHPNHRGIGHTHTPAEDPRGRARALLNRRDLRMTIPEYVYETARMMLDPSNDLDVIVKLEHIDALYDDQAKQPNDCGWSCCTGKPATHSCGRGFCLCGAH